MGRSADRPLGLIAGGGEFPRHLLAALRERGYEVVLVAFRGETDEALARSVDRVIEAEVGEVERVIAFLKEHGVREALMAGYVSHTNMLRRPRLDSIAARVLARLADRRADTLLKAAALQLRLAGIRLASALPYLEEMVPKCGTLTRREPTEEEWRDVEFGRGIARGIGKLDIGQTVAVKGRAVVAVEALEGTDAAIRRAGEVGREGVVIVKLAKPKQDLRFDLPVAGPRTIESLKAAGAAVLAVEAGRTILLDREEMVRAADEAGIALVAIR